MIKLLKYDASMNWQVVNSEDPQEAVDHRKWSRGRNQSVISTKCYPGGKRLTLIFLTGVQVANDTVPILPWHVMLVDRGAVLSTICFSAYNDALQHFHKEVSEQESAAKEADLLRKAERRALRKEVEFLKDSQVRYGKASAETAARIAEITKKLASTVKKQNKPK